MSKPEEPIPSLSQIEAEVSAEGREWTQRRMQERLQQLADQHGEFSPQSQRKLVHRHRHKFHLRTGAGNIELAAWYGQDPQDERWGCPLRELWKLPPRQGMSPGWMETLAFTVTATTSYLMRVRRRC